MRVVQLLQKREGCMHEDREVNSGTLWRERAFVKVFLAAVFLALAHFIHTSYFTGYSMGVSSLPQPSNLSRPALATAHAPEAYRVAIPALNKFLVRMFHAHDPTAIAAALDFVFGSIASYLLYRVAVAGFPATGARMKERLLVVAFFLAFLQLAFPWVVHLQRPETLPSALFLAIALYCLTRSGEGVTWSLVLLAAAAIQGFIRADVPFTFGIGLALASLMGDNLAAFGSRYSTLLKGIGIALVSGAAQAYLQLVRFPHLTYMPGTSVIQFRNNFGLHNLSNCLIAIFPYLALGCLLIIKRVRLDAVDTVVVVVSLVYLPVWFTVGLVDEVRIYVPFLMLLSVVAAKCLTSCILGDEPSDAR